MKALFLRTLILVVSFLFLLSPVFSQDYQPSDELIKCFIQAVGQDRYNQISSGQSQPTEEEKTKLNDCFSKFGSYKPPEQPTYTSPSPYEPQPAPTTTQPPADIPHDASPTQINEEIKNCMIAALGEARWNEISSGAFQPTLSEQEAGKKCFSSKYGEYQPPTSPRGDLDEKTVSCLKETLGDAFDSIMSGKTTPNLEQRQKAERCFGGGGSSVIAPPHPQPDETMIACLKEAVGEERFNLIKSGKAEPTEEERAKGEKCFKAANLGKYPNASALMPLPSDQVPFLNEDPNTAPAPTVKTEGTTVVISGTVKGSEYADLYVFSEPIVTTVKADKAGNYSYKIDKPLEEGDHTVYSTVNKGTDSVRSPKAPLTVGKAVAAEKEEAKPSAVESAALTTGDYVLLIGELVLLAILVIILIIVHRRHQIRA